MRNSIPAPTRHHVGMYYYCAYWQKWDKILEPRTKGVWHVVEVDILGNPVAAPREHSTALDVGRCADKPFVVTAAHLYPASFRRANCC